MTLGVSRLSLVAVMVAAIAAHACGQDEALEGGDLIERDPRGLGGEANAAAGAGSTAEAGEGGTGDRGGQAGADARAGEGGGGGRGCTPEPAVTDTPVRGLALRQITVLQAVSVPIMERLLEVPTRRAALISDRPGLMRVFVLPEPAWQTRSVRARLTLEQGGQSSTFEASSLVVAASHEANISSTFNFDLPSGAFTEGTGYAVDLFETQSCADEGGSDAAARFPVEGTVPLEVQPAPSVRVLLVPVALEVAGETFVPDTSAAQLELLRREVLKLFPITKVELQVRETPLASSAPDILGVLDEVSALRDEENTDPGLSYYGLVKFGPDLASYCSPKCVLGGSAIGEVPSGGVAVGIGYAGAKAALTFAHELGHVYGRPHSPCGVAGDGSYPYAGGGIGGWGYDIFEHTLIDPATHGDFMGYCSPAWVSDHTFEHLRTFLSEVPEAQPASAERRASGRRFRTLIRPAQGLPRWGRSRIVSTGTPPGRPEAAVVRGAGGSGRVAIHRVRVDDDGSELIYVPEELERPWKEVRIDGLVPQAFPRGLGD